ncbi:amidase signature enzyme [Nemania sp. FL0031]|nr:amidase signature enzyme [Nemania sp. FL0031]
MTPPLYTLTAVQALSLLKSDKVKVEQYAQSLLRRYHDNDNTVKAWAYLDSDLVLNQARALDQVPKDQRGPLHGLAIGVKDTMNTKDMPTQFGSPIYKGHQSGFDCSAVAILRAAGALIFGKTTTTEFTVTNSGPDTTNPHDPKRTPGGSSCGSAAAVADMQVPLSLGAQTGGSIIRPASFSGVFAMKPTHNAISTEGQKTFAPTFDTFGFFARSIEDLQLLADVFALKDDEPPQEVSIDQVTFALIKTPFWASAGPGTIEAIEEAATILQKCGATFDEVYFPSEVPDVETLKRMQKVIIEGEAQAAFIREYRVDKANLAPEICGLVENASNYTKKERLQAYDTYANMRRLVDSIAEEYSVILTPSAIDEAPLGLGDMGRATFNTLWTGLHMPVINIPAFHGPNDMPIGVSLVAPRYRDQHLLKVGQILGETMIQNA